MSRNSVLLRYDLVEVNGEYENDDGIYVEPFDECEDFG